MLTCEQRHEALCSTVDDVDLVQAHGMHDLAALLNLALGTLNKSCIRPHSIVIPTPREATTKLGDPSRSLVDCDNVPSKNFVLGERVDHFVSEVVDGLHVGGLNGQATRFGCASERAVDLEFDNLALDNFCFFFNTDTDGAAKCLGESLSFGEGQGEDLGGGDGGERNVRAKTLCHACEVLGRRRRGRKNIRDSPIAIAVFPELGGPAKSIARPAIRPS